MIAATNAYSHGWLVISALLFGVAFAPIGYLKYPVLMAIIAVDLIRGGTLALPPSLRGPATGLLLWTALSIAWAPDRQRAIVALFWVLSVALVAMRAMAPGERSLAAATRSLLLVAIVGLCHGLAQFLGLAAHDDWANPTRLAGTFVNSNMYAAFAGTILALGLGVVWARGAGLSLRLLALLGVLLAAISLPLTVSRGGWLAAACGLAVTILLFARSRGAAPLNSRLVVVSVAVAGLGLVAVLLLQAGWLTGALERLRGAGSHSLGHRLVIYQATLLLIRAHPLGVGTGNYSVVLPEFRVHSDRFLVNAAHCEPLELLAELGVPGMVLALMILVRVVPQARPDGPLHGAAIAGLATLAVQSLYDFPLRKPLLAIVAAALLGGLCETTARPMRRLWSRSLGVGLLAVALPLGYGETLRSRADAAMGSGNPFRGAELYAAADPYLLFGETDNARTAGAANLRLARAPLIGRRYLERARGWYDLAVERNPRDAFSWFARAELAAGLGEQAPASTAYQAAVAAAPRAGKLVGAAGAYAQRWGDGARAVALYATAIDLSPDRTPASTLASAAAALAVPPEFVAGALDPHSDWANEIDGQLRAHDLTLAAELYAARRAPRALTLTPAVALRR